MNPARLTCLVPTHNRPHFLRRLLRFYLQFPLGYPFLVVDSSEAHFAAENRAVIDDVRGLLKIDYLHLDLNFMDKSVAGLERIRSPYVVFCADDDYLFPAAAMCCIDFLESHPGYSSAMGRTAMLNVNYPVQWCRIIKGYSIEHERPFDRCRQIARSWFTNFYAVHRTPSLLDNFRTTAANTDSQRCPHLFESLLSQLSVLDGRTKLLPLMYSLREQHGSNAGSLLRNKQEPQAEQLFLRFKECLVEQLQLNGIDRAEAVRFVDDMQSLHRHPSSPAETIHKFCRGVMERTVDFFSTDRTRHRRFVRSSDLAGCESTWRCAVKLMREFPHGISAETSPLKHCA